MNSAALKRAPKIGLLLTTLSAAFGICAVPAHASPPRSPAGRVLVVTANLQEAYGNRDVKHHRDMKIFVRRLVARTPYAPDALLLQEVRHSSAHWVAKRLKKKTNSRYTIKVDPGADPTRHTGRLARFRETAILFNKDTMAGRGGSRYFNTKPKWSEVPHHDKPSIMQHAVIGGTERSSGLAVAFASVHLAPRNRLRDSAEKAARDRWANGLASFMNKRYSGTRLRSVGGDFNSSRCKHGGGKKCPLSPFWRSMARDKHYRDGLRQVAVHGGVDFVFTKAGIYRGGVDGYNPKKAKGHPTRFYSDHRFRWVLVGPDTKAPTAPQRFSARGRRPNIALDWSASTDRGDSGLRQYDVWRSGGNDNFRLERTLPAGETRYVDRSTFHTRTYQYYVVARDGAHNVSAKSRTVRIAI